MDSSMYTINNGNKHLIICFGGRPLNFSGILPFEFLTYLSKIYPNICDLIFFIDKNQCWYHRGIKDITNNIDETVLYLNNIILKGNYDKVLFMGTSAGGYAAILFGSLCNNVDGVISFIPQTILKNPIDIRYENLKTIINNKTKYIIHGQAGISDINDLHHILHCENIENYRNIKVIKHNKYDIKQLRDTCVIKENIDSILFSNQTPR